MNNNRKIKRLFNRNIDRLYIACKGISKSWKAKSISIGVLQHVINKYKMGASVELPQKFKDNYNKTLDLLLKTAREQSVSNAVSFSDLKQDIEIIKRSFAKGLDGQLK